MQPDVLTKTHARTGWRGARLWAVAALAFIAAVMSAAVHAEEAGDASAGQAKYRQLCAGCHSVTDNRTGPAHRGVVGRQAGTFPGFDYSEALRASRVVWTRQTLEAWLSDPEKLIPGQAMYFSVSDAKARADVIAYLATLPK